MRALQLLLHIAVFGCSLAESSVTPSFIIQNGGSITVEASVNSDLINVTNVQSEAECLVRCRLGDCAAAGLMKGSGICQLLFIFNASQTPGPPGSCARKLMGSGAVSAQVWRAENFEDLLRMGTTKAPIVFSNTSTGRNGSVQQAIITATGCYLIEAVGASGGENNFASTKKLCSTGAKVSGRFNLIAGTQLSIVVGQMGGNTSATYTGTGGGGGSFVYGTTDSHLYLAAGGGGGASSWYSGRGGEAGINGTDSQYPPTYASYPGFGGANGQPGFNNPNATAALPGMLSCHGGCGAGWLGKAVNPRRSSSDGDRGGSLADGWVGGQAGSSVNGDGGFGGGGGGGNVYGAGGGGGGFSGGGAGVQYSHAGGGGGSACFGSGCTGTAGGNSSDCSHGSVVLQLVSLDAC